MKFSYKNSDFELCEMVDPYKNETFDIISIFRVKYVAITKDFEKIELSKNDDYEFEDYEYINYFCRQDNQQEDIQAAKWYIDEWLKNKL